LPIQPIAKRGATVIDVNDLELEKTFWQAALGVDVNDEPAGYVFSKLQMDVLG